MTEKEQYQATRNSYTAAKRKVQYPESFVGLPAAMCKRWWDSFGSFVEDMGMRSEGQILCRIDNTKPYGKDNCKWLTLGECRRQQGMVAGTVKPDGLPVGMALEGSVVRAETDLTNQLIDNATLAQSPPLAAGQEMGRTKRDPVEVEVVDLGDCTPVGVVKHDDVPDMLQEKQLEQANEVAAETPPLDDELDDLLDDFDPWEEKDNE